MTVACEPELLPLDAALWQLDLVSLWTVHTKGSTSHGRNSASEIIRQRIENRRIVYK